MFNEAQWIGRTIGGAYKLEKLLGSGGMGAVFQAHHLRTGGKLAVKLTNPSRGMHEAFRKRLLQEATIISRLSHPHIVQVHDVGEDLEGNPYLVMEMLTGEDLATLISRNGPLSLKETLNMAQQVGSGLHAAHQQGIIHRDVKPQNIFVTHSQIAEHSQNYYKVLDFGISRINGTSMGTTDGAVLGTPCYISPEAVQGQPVDARADQYALAVMIFYAITGRVLFESNEPLACMFKTVHEIPPPLRSFNPKITEAFENAIERALSKDKASRFNNIEDFISALTTSATKKTQNDIGKLRVRATAFFVGTLAAIGLLGAGWSPYKSSSRLYPKASPQFRIASPQGPSHLSGEAKKPDDVPSTAPSTVTKDQNPFDTYPSANLPSGSGPVRRQSPRRLGAQRERSVGVKQQGTPPPQSRTPEITTSEFVP